jgi:hypothetical protein
MKRTALFSWELAESGCGGESQKPGLRGRVLPCLGAERRQWLVNKLTPSRKDIPQEDL